MPPIPTRNDPYFAKQNKDDAPPQPAPKKSAPEPKPERHTVIPAFP